VNILRLHVDKNITSSAQFCFYIFCIPQTRSLWLYVSAKRRSQCKNGTNLNSCHYNHELILLFFRIYSLYRLNFTLSEKEWWPSEKDDYLIMFAKCCDGGLGETVLRRLMIGSSLRRSKCLLAECLEKRVWFLRKTLRLLYT